MLKKHGIIHHGELHTRITCNIANQWHPDTAKRIIRDHWWPRHCPIRALKSSGRFRSIRATISTFNCDNPLPRSLSLNAKNAWSGSVPTTLINSATPQEAAADLTLYQKGLPTNVSACVRECVRACVRVCVRAGTLFTKTTAQVREIACVHEKSRGTTSREGHEVNR